MYAQRGASQCDLANEARSFTVGLGKLGLVLGPFVLTRWTWDALCADKKTPVCEPLCLEVGKLDLSRFMDWEKLKTRLSLRKE